MHSMFDWDDARVFLAVVRQRTFSAAGRALGVQQSTIGRRLAAFEARLGARLFERVSGGHLLTPAGQTLLVRAERMESEALSAERILIGSERRSAGVVRITAPQAFGDLFLVPLLAQVQAEHPDILVELIADNANLNLTRREADIALRLGRPKQPLLVARRVGVVAHGLYASRAYLARRGLPEGEDLTGHQFVDYDDTYLQKQELAWFRQRLRGARCALRTNGTHGRAAAVGAGLGIGALPCWLGDAAENLVRVLPGERFAQDLWLVVHRDMRRLARVRAVSGVLIRELLHRAVRLSGERTAAGPRGSG